MSHPLRPQSSRRSAPRRRGATLVVAYKAALGLLVGCALAPAVPAAATWIPQDPPAQADTPPAAPAKPFIRGQLSTRYLLRWTGNQNDSDLYSTLSVDVGDPDQHDVTAYLMGRATYDLDGRDSTFTSLNDAYGDSLDGLLYDAYVDLHRVSSISILRLGRQSIFETPAFIYFDGAHVQSEPIGDTQLQVGGYVGSSVHLYESSKTGDLTAGGYAQLRPWSTGRFRFDYLHLEDQARFGSHQDGLFGAGFWQNFGPALQFETQYSRIESRDRDVRARLVSMLADAGLTLQVTYYNLLRAQGDLVLELDPYFNSLNQLRPYDQWSLLASQQVGSMLQLQAAGDLRRVRDRADVGIYNRDFDHYYGTANLSNFGVEGLSLSGTVDLWDSTAQLMRTWGGDLAYEHGKSTYSLGTYYSLYKFDLFSNSERDHVRTYYFKVRYAASESVTLHCDYELEDVDLDDFHRFRMGVTWRF